MRGPNGELIRSSASRPSGDLERGQMNGTTGPMGEFGHACASAEEDVPAQRRQTRLLQDRIPLLAGIEIFIAPPPPSAHASSLDPLSEPAERAPLAQARRLRAPAVPRPAQRRNQRPFGEQSGAAH